ncbi:cytochrome C [Marivita sp. XM-24bin2]|jgi:cytochrome c|uniref:c-type cytochrome n=1 Tax=unclassified Marivita TaxID=2632480 RepID=UPI000D78E8BF|nr:cytochrome C [Marivita sp. XM-24bin2]MCR9109205.1 cytochrome C [Paracoccaceae bacterium]PWL34768.1 MAG: cytochrome C [Marivita sp. XM-24bin2]
MKLMFATAATAMTLAGAAFAESHAGSGDAEAGEKEFNKCKSCHMIVADDGTEIVKGGRTGPNLYGVIGRQAGSVEDYRYGDSLVAAGEAGLVWDKESFVAYVQDPKGFLVEYLDDSSARSKMSYRLRKGMEDVYAYLVSVGPDSGS